MKEKCKIPFVLERCRDKETAFSNWMERDVLFAQEVQRQCDKEKYISILNDGSIEVDELVNKVAAYLRLGD